MSTLYCLEETCKHNGIAQKKKTKSLKVDAKKKRKKAHKKKKNKYTH